MSLLQETSRLTAKKNIDTRTFTRPKKKFVRPSLDFGSSYSSDQESTKPNYNDEMNIPNFDLSKPISKDPFESSMINSNDSGNFMNMSPPSLITSLSSSTYINQMENSMSKDDLFQMKTSGYCEQILLQDTEQPLFKSLTESCSSLCSDVYDRKQLPSFNGTFNCQNFTNSINSEASIECKKSFNETIIGK